MNLSTVTSGTVTLTADRALDVSNIRAGTFILKVVQGGSGGYKLTYPAAVKFPGGSAPDHSTSAAGEVDVVTFYSDGTTMYAVAQQGFA
jgi:hypothetical protein